MVFYSFIDYCWDIKIDHIEIVVLLLRLWASDWLHLTDHFAVISHIQLKSYLIWLKSRGTSNTGPPAKAWVPGPLLSRFWRLCL